MIRPRLRHGLGLLFGALLLRGLKLLAGPGFERKHEHADTEMVLRIGAAYSFEFAHRFSVAPSIAGDFIGRENALVYGVNLGVRF